MSRVKHFICHNTGITLYDLRVNLHIRISPWDDKSESDVKALCDPHKKRSVLHSFSLDFIYDLVRAQLFTREADYSSCH